MSKNPLDYVTEKDIIELGLSPDEVAESYNPSGGGVFHARGIESTGKTLLIVHYYRHLIDSGIYTPYDAVGNITIKGKYGIGYTVLKGDDLRQYLWDLTHKPYEHKIVIIDEADSEFPARLFTDREQTEVSLRLWHTAKLHNYIFLSSHIGNSTDVIMHLATHYYLYPQIPSFETNTLDFTVVNRLDMNITEWTAQDVIKSMLIYNRRELTENILEEQNKIRPSLIKNKRKTKITEINDDLDLELEWEKGLSISDL